MHKLLITCGSFALVTAATAIAGAPATKTVTAAANPVSTSYKGAELASSAAVTMEAARALALKARPGKVTDAELEKERGGSGLRYSFDISSHGKPYEVGIDAKTGKLLENKAEGKHAD